MRQSVGVPTQDPKERKYRRFDLRVPVSLRFTSGGTARIVKAISKNISVGGLLVQAGDEVALHTQVRVTMNVAGVSSQRSIRLQGEGEIVRVEPIEPETGFLIAVACAQPIVEMEDQLRGRD